MAIGSSVCPSCGTGLSAEHQFCPQCGAGLRRSAKLGFRSGVGVPLEIPGTVWRRAVPPFVTLIGAFLPWLTFSTPNIMGGGVSRSVSLVSAGFAGWLAVVVLATAVAVGAWPLWQTTAVPGWVPRVWLAVGASCFGAGLVMLVMASSLVRLIGIVVGSSFGGTSPLQVGFGAALFLLGALAWTVVGGRRTWD